MLQRDRPHAERLRRQPLPTIFVSLAAVICSAGTAASDTFTWTGNAPAIIGLDNANWTNLFNWQDQAIPANDGSADVVIPDTPRDNSVVNDPWSIKSLTFQGASALSVGGDELAVNDITHNGSAAATFNNSVGVSGSGALWRADSGPMTFNGAITGTNSVTIQAPHTVTFDGSAVNTLFGAVTVTEGTLVLSKSSASGAIAGNLNISNATVRWDAADQVSDALSSQVSVQGGGVANLNGRNETLGQLTLLNGGRVESTGGKLTLVGQLGMQGSGEVDLGTGELELQLSVVRSGSASATSRIEAGVVTLNRVQAIFSVSDAAVAVELEVAADIDGAFATTFLEKSGDGALRLTGANAYQAGTTISGGVLIVDNTSGSGTGPGTVTVATGATLTGDGAIGGPVTMQNGATITPSSTTGTSIGSLTIGSLSMNTTSEFEVQFNQALPITSRRDVLTVIGAATLNGNLVLENLNAGMLPTAATTFIVLDAATLAGSFANVANGARLATVDGSGSLVVNYGSGSAFDATQVVLSSFLPTGLDGDFDHDGDVDGRDFLVWQRGGSPSPLSAGDLADWKANFGATGGMHFPVPEPHAGILVLMAFAAAFSRRRPPLVDDPPWCAA
jgi:autotransporter-associated beta strand protein